MATDDISFDSYQDVIVGTQRPPAGGIAHLLAFCDGTPAAGVIENVAKNIRSVYVYPKISRSSFYINSHNVEIENISIYDATGRLVKSYDKLSGELNKVIWHTKDDQGRRVSQGIYFIKIQGKDYSQTEKVIIVW